MNIYAEDGVHGGLWVVIVVRVSARVIRVADGTDRMRMQRWEDAIMLVT